MDPELLEACRKKGREMFEERVAKEEVKPFMVWVEVYLPVVRDDRKTWYYVNGKPSVIFQQEYNLEGEVVYEAITEKCIIECTRQLK